MWGYRLTQGLHIASGIAAIPLLLAKLWTVYPRLFAWPPVRSVRHALERLSVAVLVAAAVFEVATGLLNTAQWYPWPFSFVPVHYAVAWLLAGALVLHIAVKAPEIRAHWSRRSPGTLALPEEDGADRRSLLTAVAAAVGAATVTTVGQSFTPLKDLALLSPRHPDHGPQDLPVNRTAAAAGVGLIPAERYRLTVAGPLPYTLTLDELRALPQHEAELPIACVEGWSRSARWRGVRVRGPAGDGGRQRHRAGVGSSPCNAAGAIDARPWTRRTSMTTRRCWPWSSRASTPPRSRVSGAADRTQPAGRAADEVGRTAGGPVMRVSVLRVLTGAAGVALMGFGASLLSDVRDLTGRWSGWAGPWCCTTW